MIYRYEITLADIGEGMRGVTIGLPERIIVFTRYLSVIKFKF